MQTAVQRNEPSTSTLPCIRNNPNKTTLALARPFGAFHTSGRCEESQEYRVGSNKNPNQKQPGEKASGKFHYNPGNMSGKTAGTKKDDSKPQAAADKGNGHPDPQGK
jgi:hypothetical protein